MAPPRGLLLPAVLLTAAGVGFGVLGGHALRLEGDLARRRARARAELSVRDAAADAPTRLARGDGPEIGRVRLHDATGVFERVAARVPEPVRLLFDQALFLERQGRHAEARTTWERVATAPDAGDLAPVAAAHATAVALRADTGRPPPPPPAAERGVTEDGLPLAPWCAYLRLALEVQGGATGADLAAAVEGLLAAPDGHGVRTDGGPDAGDLLVRAVELVGDPRLATLPPALASRLRARAAQATLAHRALARLARAPLAVLDDVIAAKVPQDPAVVRFVAVDDLGSALADALPGTVRATTRPDTIPAGAARTQAPTPLDGLWVYDVPTPGPLEGSGPWLLLAAGLAVYAAAAVATLLALRRARRTREMKDDFVAAVSHEMKTPIAGVAAMAELIADDAGLPDRTRRYAERIRVEMARLGATVRDVLDAARIERDPTSAIRPRNVEPADVVKEAAATVRPALERRGFAVEVDVTAAGRPLALDPDALAHVLHNLLDNAAKFTTDRREVAVHAAPRDGGYRIEVLDRGPGVPPAERARVFDRFVRGAAAREGAVPGVGLGLHVARALVTAHGGSIDVTERDGGGARFVVDLPAPSGSAPTAARGGTP